ncbi:Protein spinsterlike, partial [Caligus rogercresseyi]
APASNPRADPIICGTDSLYPPSSWPWNAPCTEHIILTFVFLFAGEVALNLNWSIVADILLYVVIPTRRSTAEAIQILVSHALGDAEALTSLDW